MATASASLARGVGLVLVEFQYEYEGRDGSVISIKPNERYVLLAKTNAHWWQVRRDHASKPFYIPAKYVKELPPDVPSPLDFAHPPGPEAAAGASVPVPIPVPVPVPATLEELGRTRSKPSDELTIRLRPDASGVYRKTENRMSTFGVPLDLLDSPLPLATGPLHSGTHSGSDALEKCDGVSGKILPDGKEKSGKARVPGFGQADPSGVRPHALPVPVDTPTVPEVHAHKDPEGVPPQEDAQEPAATPKEIQEGEAVEPTEDDSLDSDEEPKEDESNHIYESIQDLQLDTLIGQLSPPPTLKQALDPGPDPPRPFYASGRAPSSSSASSEVVSPSPLSPQHGRQGTSEVWEQLMDGNSGRLYYYNRLSGATSWKPPRGPEDDDGGGGGGLDDCPPPLPEEDYPVDNDGVFATHAERLAIPRARPERRDGVRTANGDGLPDQRSAWRHSVAEDTFVSRHWGKVNDFADCKRASPDTAQLCDRLRLRRNLSNRSTDSQQGHLLEKAGIVNKTKVVDNGRKIRKNWSQSWTVLHGGILTFHRDPKSAPSSNMVTRLPPSQPPSLLAQSRDSCPVSSLSVLPRAVPQSKASQIVPEYTVELRGASVSWAPKDKSSKKNVLELRTRQGCEYLMQYDTESIIADWLKVIQDTVRQLEQEHASDDDDDDDASSDKEEKDRKQTSNRSFSGGDSERTRVRTKLRRFLQRRPTLQSVKEKGYIRDNVFGCHLDTLCHRENTTVPKFVDKCIRAVERRGLDVDGLYRVSGNLAVIQKLRHKADHEEHLDLEDGQWEDVHVLTGALKLFFRELPEPLFPFSFFEKFIAAIQVPDYSLRVSYMKDLVRSLPLPNHDTMQLLFRHLRWVVEHKDTTRMSIQGTAIVFGPTLLRPQTESSNVAVHMVFQSQIVELVLNEFHAIFVPT
ncbi:rho GTPase-activating protein 27 isoform X2 [Syngnathoides biaculeatus]|uniref:rho GTPase-activating protein 27 isoform X2 n=1 Tax=Syngnathoides biaculeatus TaxID=300417 RepID=UPI002ADD6E7A|nr:rho GTPase-activating protein 27 isoform X2 [Syngnathoides biaculeatus]